MYLDRIPAPAQRAVPMPGHRDTWGDLEGQEQARLFLTFKTPPICCYAILNYGYFYLNQIEKSKSSLSYSELTEMLDFPFPAVSNSHRELYQK